MPQNGFRHLLLSRAVRANLPPASIRALSGIDGLSRLAKYAPARRRGANPHPELARLTSRWPHWL